MNAMGTLLERRDGSYSDGLARVEASKPRRRKVLTRTDSSSPSPSTLVDREALLYRTPPATADAESVYY
jgi:hypothetical protein